MQRELGSNPDEQRVETALGPGRAVSSYYDREKAITILQVQLDAGGEILINAANGQPLTSTRQTGAETVAGNRELGT